MAGDWIKVEHETPDKPEVVAIAAALDIDQDAVFGKLMRLWMWADQNTVDGYAPRVTKTFVDRYCHAPGMAVAMEEAGWLLVSDGGLTIPKFDRHNGKSAKHRALTKNRMKTLRTNGYGPSVTNASPDEEEEREVFVDVKTKDAGVVALKDFDWESIRDDCRKASQSIPCKLKQDASIVVKAVVLSRTRFSQAWLWDSVEATRLKDTPNKPRYFTGVLRAKCKESGLNLNALLKQIEIPDSYFRKTVTP